MSEIPQLLLLFAVGSIAGFINVMAGGGSTITLPTLIFLGLDSALANGTNRIAIFIQNIFAITSFRKQKVHRFKQSLQLAFWTLPGAVLGAIVAVRLTDAWFQRILGIIMIAIIISMFFSPAKNNKEESRVERLNWLIYPAMLGIGFYGGFIQVGVGFILMAALYHLLHLNLVFVNMHKVFIVFIYTIPALAIFIWTGNVNWVMGLSLAAGNAFGGWWSARFAVKGGEKIIRVVLSIAILIMALKLFGFF
jgi:uncharacterized membrane protein YfcA